LLVARMTVGAAETRRLAAVLAGQASVLLGQLELVDALDRERRMMNAILRHSPVGVLLEDAAGNIVYANPEIEAIYSLQASEMPGRKPDEIYAAAGAIPAEVADADGTLELRMKDPDRTVHVRRVVIPGLEGEPAGVLTLHEDVTVQRQALEAKDLMLRAIGHEVRSPAAAMKNTLAGIMQWDETIDSTGRRTLLQEAYESSDRLLSLVESQLIIAKLETRHFEPVPEPIDLASAGNDRRGRGAQSPLRGADLRCGGQPASGVVSRFLRTRSPRPGADEPDRQRTRVHKRFRAG
jgi:PAS domain S-box-containing protein